MVTNLPLARPLLQLSLGNLTLFFSECTRSSWHESGPPHPRSQNPSYYVDDGFILGSLSFLSPSGAPDLPVWLDFHLKKNTNENSRPAHKLDQKASTLSPVSSIPHPHQSLHVNFQQCSTKKTPQFLTFLEPRLDRRHVAGFPVACQDKFRGGFSQVTRRFHDLRSTSIQLASIHVPNHPRRG